MLVRERMTPNPITVYPDTPFEEALHLLREKKIRRLPVVDRQGQLVGIVVEKDLLYASPSPATALTVFAIPDLLSQLQGKEIMTKRVLTVDEDCPVEDAARIMLDQKIGSLPVLRGHQLVGIITETDLFKVMAESLGGRAKGLRITVRVPEGKGELASLTGEIARLGGNIVSLTTFWGSDPQQREITMKLQEVDREALTAALARAGAEVIDIREINNEYRPQLLSSR